MPDYFNTLREDSPDDETEKTTILELRLFNSKDHDIHFSVVLELFHGLFADYFNSNLRGKIYIEFYNANR